MFRLCPMFRLYPIFVLTVLEYVLRVFDLFLTVLDLFSIVLGLSFDSARLIFRLTQPRKKCNLTVLNLCFVLA